MRRKRIATAVAGGVALALPGLIMGVKHVWLQAPEPATASLPARKPQLAQAYGKIPMSFEPNRGQAPEEVRFLARGGGFALMLTPEAAILNLRSSESAESQGELVKARRDPLIRREDRKIRSRQLSMSLIGAKADPKMFAESLQEGRSNYFIGQDKSKWQRDVPHYGKVRYQQVYPGIDLVYYGNPTKLEYDFIIAPGADPDQIRFRIDGIEQLSVNENGDLILKVPGGELKQRAPFVYQEKAGQRQTLSGQYQILADGSIGFQLAAYDRALALVVDPVLEYSTYLGVPGGDKPADIAVDNLGNAYVAGSDIFYNTFITKLNAAGNGVVYSTFLGGNFDDYARSVAIDESGSAYVTGYTNSSDFANGGSCAVDDSYDAFIAKLGPAGNLVYSFCLGGSGSDFANSIAVDGAHNAYVAGVTDSSSPFDNVGGIEGPQGDNDAFIAKLNPAGSSLVYSTYLGGTNDDVAAAIAVDGAGNAYITGLTGSSDFNKFGGIRECHDEVNEVADVFVSKLNAAGDQLLYSTCLGDPDSYQSGQGIAVDGIGNAYVAGREGSEVFVVKLNAVGDTVVYSTTMEGSYGQAEAIAVDNIGNAYIAGITNSSNFNNIDGYQGGDDAFVAKLTAAGAVIYSTYLGGTEDDAASAIAIDSIGDAYVTGTTASSEDFPVEGGIPGEVNSETGGDGFVAKLKLSELEGAGQVDFSSIDYTVAENGGSAEITLVRSGGSSGAVSVFVAYSGVTAAPGQDFSSGSAQLQWGNSEDGERKFTIPIINDQLPEGSETLLLSFDPAGGLQSGPVDHATLTIIDDDVPNLSIADASIPEGNAGTSQMVFMVGLSVASTQPVTVNYATADGTAQAGEYQPASGSLTFKVGETSKPISISIAGDTTPEPDKTFFVNLSGAENASIGDAQAMGTIVNDDASASLSIADASMQEGDAGTSQIVFTVSLAAASATPVAVKYATANDTADAADYSSSTGMLNFAPGETSKTIGVSVVGDAAVEPNETFFVNLSEPVNAVIADAQAIGTIVNDDAQSATVFQFSALEFSGSEASKEAVVTVVRAGSSPNPVSVQISTQGGTATAGSDYQSKSERLTWSPNDPAEKTFKVAVTDDSVLDDGETFNVVMSDPQGDGSVGMPSSAVVRIVSNDLVQSGVVNDGTASVIKASITPDQGSISRFVAVSSEPPGFAAAIATTNLKLQFLAGLDIGLVNLPAGTIAKAGRRVTLTIQPPPDVERSAILMCPNGQCTVVPQENMRTNAANSDAIDIDVEDGNPTMDADAQVNEKFSTTFAFALNVKPKAGGGGGGCFIATAAYGSYLDPHVRSLRLFRDQHLLTNEAGRAFVRAYYELSPPVADVIAQNRGLRLATRLALTPVVFAVEAPRTATVLVVLGALLWLRRSRKHRLAPDGAVR